MVQKILSYDHPAVNHGYMNEEENTAILGDISVLFNKTCGTQIYPYYILGAHNLRKWDVFIIFYNLYYGVYDLSRLFTQAWSMQNLFTPLKDLNFFWQLRTEHKGSVISWGNTIDIGAEELFFDTENLFPDVILQKYKT